MSIIVIAVIFLIILNMKEKQIKELQNEIKRLRKMIEGTGSTLQEDMTSEEIKVENIKKVKKIVSPKDKMSQAEKKNVTILITGSIFIVLAAIVFLTTAWNSIPNIIKTITLLLFVGVFLGASKLANEKFHLKKASKTFFYIAMAYLPISFLSISIFGLFGDYFAIWGAGNYIYLGFSAVVLALIYYYVSKKDENNFLIYGSILSQLLAVLLFSLLFEERIFLAFVNLLMYNILLMLLTKNTAFKNVSNYIPVIVAAIVIFEVVDITIYTILTFLLLAINFLLLEIRKTHILKSIAFNASLIGFGFSLIFKESFGFSEGLKQVLMILYIMPIFIIENLIFMKNKNGYNILKSARILFTICMSYIYAYTFLNELISIFMKIDLPLSTLVIGTILMGMFIFNYKISNSPVYKYLAYSFLHILLLDIAINVFKEANIAYLTPMISSIIIMYIEKNHYKNKNYEMIFPLFISISQGIALYSTYMEDAEVSTIIAIIYVVIIILYNRKFEIPRVYNTIPLLVLIPNILNTNLSTELQLGIMILASASLTFLSINIDKLNIYTIFSALYLIIGVDIYNNEYLSEMLFIIWSAVHVYYLVDQKSIDIFKSIFIIAITCLYYSICEDLKLNEYTIFNFLGCIVAGFTIIKKILKNYVADTDVFEYVFWAIIYVGALASYTNSIDGIIFSLLIVGIIFLSYYKKYGATFLASILAIILNGIALTRVFWLSIPWWIYLLIVGGTLIGFAIKNEANENKLSLKKVLKNIKENCEK